MQKSSRRVPKPDRKTVVPSCNALSIYWKSQSDPVIVFNLDPAYDDVRTSTRAGDLWRAASSATQRYVIIGLKPTTRRVGSNRSSGQQQQSGGVHEPIVVAASPPTQSSSASLSSTLLSLHRLFSCLLFTAVFISCCSSARCLRHSFSMTMS